MSFDPKTNAAQLAALIARCDFKQFVVNTSPTNLIAGGHPYQQMFLADALTTRFALSFTAVYRGLKVSQPVLVVAATLLLLGQAAVLDAASKCLDTLDLRADVDGANPNVYAPQPQ